MLQISIKELYTLLQKPTTTHDVVLDVRTPEEVQALSIGNINMPVIYIPLTDLEENIDQLKDYDTMYVLCRSGGRSQIAALQLTQAGIKHIYNIEGGILAWKKAGYPVRTKSFN